MNSICTKTLELFKSALLGFADFAWPNLCRLCSNPLVSGEKCLCYNCLYSLPTIRQNSFTENQTADRLSGRICFERAASGFKYEKEAKIQKAIELLKYKGEKEIGYLLGQWSGVHLLDQGFLQGIDCIVPVPLHPSKLKKRGYNQSLWISMGIEKVSGIKILPYTLKRTISNPTQTTKNVWSRWENSQKIFALDQYDDVLGKHILIVDDVLTSGSTFESCGNALLQIPNVRLSFFALALA